MNNIDLARRIASHLVDGPWTCEALETRLQRALPVWFADQARSVARDLLADFPQSVAPDRDRIARAWTMSELVTRLQRHPTFRAANLPLALAPPHFVPAAPFADLPIPQLTTSAGLAEWLGLEPAQLIRYADLRSLSARAEGHFAPHYRHTIVAKSKGGVRLIEAPKPRLKSLQRQLLRGILDHIPAHPASHGFIKRRTAITAAAPHAGEAVLVRFDIRAFFASVGHARVYGLFRHLGYPQAVARDLAGLTTAITPWTCIHRHGLDRDLAERHLPQGAPTSPALANLCLYRMDRRLAGLAHSLGAAYTRYADDLSFSGDGDVAAGLAAMVPHIVADEGFALNPAKTRLRPAHRPQQMLGITVNSHTNLPRRSYDRLKAAIHQLPTPPDPAQAQVLVGRVAWAIAINPARGEKLARSLAAKLHAP